MSKFKLLSAIALGSVLLVGCNKEEEAPPPSVTPKKTTTVPTTMSGGAMGTMHTGTGTSTDTMPPTTLPSGGTSSLPSIGDMKEKASDAASKLGSELGAATQAATKPVGEPPIEK